MTFTFWKFDVLGRLTFCDFDVLKLLTFKTFMYCDGVTLWAVYITKLLHYSLICYVTLTICDATIINPWIRIPDPLLEKMLDPDPDLDYINADPQPWLCYVLLQYPLININFLTFFLFLCVIPPSWIRLQIPNPEPDPQSQLNLDPTQIRIRNTYF